MTGQLVVVGTPIGNLDDLSPRAARALGEADVVACEDTRRTGRLLAAAGIDSPRYVVVNEHTEATAAGAIVEHVEAGALVALVSDAGMPGVSDPGSTVVDAVRRAGLPVSVVPGPTAATAALAASGLPTGRWVFEGFLPRKGAARGERLSDLAAERRAAVLYEAPHRLRRTLDDLVEACGAARGVVVGREITKLHEEWFRGTLGDAVRWAGIDEPRGELVLVLDGAAPPPEVDDAELRAALERAREAGLSTRDAVAEVTARFAVAKRRVYDLAISS